MRVRPVAASRVHSSARDRRRERHLVVLEAVARPDVADADGHVWILPHAALLPRAPSACLTDHAMDLREPWECWTCRPARATTAAASPAPTTSASPASCARSANPRPGRQAVFREAVDGVRAGLLLVFSERMAALAVRMESGQPIVQGLVAASLAQEGDPREALAVPALHRRSAEILGARHRRGCSTRPRAAPTSRAPAGCATCATPRTARGRRLRGGRRRRGLPLRARRGGLGRRQPRRRSRRPLRSRLSRRDDEPRDPPPTPRSTASPTPTSTRVASYLAQPGEVGRVLLLYSAAWTRA